jgi:predicted CXXCH cytochrome family protein
MTMFAYQRGAQRIATAAGVLVLATIGVCAQIAPGPLSRSHAQLDEMRHCTDCHKATTTEFACLDCHKEIASHLSAGRGFHAAVVNGTAPGRDCRRCHSEHKGENTQLIRTSMLDSFDHSKTGYKLEGKHATLTCQR